MPPIDAAKIAVALRAALDDPRDSHAALREAVWRIEQNIRRSPPLLVAEFTIDSVKEGVMSAHSDSSDDLSAGTMDLDILDPELLVELKPGRTIRCYLVAEEGE